MGGFGLDPIPGIAPPPAPASSPDLLTPENACLRLLSGPCAGREFALDRLRMLIGRSDPPTLRVDLDLTGCEDGLPPKISRRHAEARWVSGQLHLVDVGSVNGTWVDGERLSGPAPHTPSPPRPLRIGSCVKLAHLDFEVIAVP